LVGWGGGQKKKKHLGEERPRGMNPKKGVNVEPKRRKTCGAGSKGKQNSKIVVDGQELGGRRGAKAEPQKGSLRKNGKSDTGKFGKQDLTREPAHEVRQAKEKQDG